QYAVLVDGDNVSWRSLAQIHSKVSGLGDTPIRRIFGDFEFPHLKNWPKVARKLCFSLVNAPRCNGKSSTDPALISDGLKILNTNPEIEGFVLVSGDSDFVPLARRFHKAGKDVV
ncbi:hypothetical protein T484DRAFT_1590515, partial [Baffinella frigidus]